MKALVKSQADEGIWMEQVPESGIKIVEFFEDIECDLPLVLAHVLPHKYPQQIIRQFCG